MDLQLSGKRALITGSSIGIGEAVARALAAEGASSPSRSPHEAAVLRQATARPPLRTTQESHRPCGYKRGGSARCGCWRRRTRERMSA